jgi:RNA polymerase sigma-70 factor (ECF subfamily)
MRGIKRRTRGDTAHVTAPTDEALMLGVARGERDALALLYARHGDRVHRIAWRFLHDDEEARDVTQAVFLGLIDGARQFRPEARFTTWLYRVVANRCLNHKARAEVRLRAREFDDEALEAMPGPSAGGPERQAAQHELQSRLVAALDHLPARQRLAVVLTDVEGMAQAEVAHALDCSVGAVESLLVRARQSLRETLRERP